VAIEIEDIVSRIFKTLLALIFIFVVLLAPLTLGAWLLYKLWSGMSSSPMTLQRAFWLNVLLMVPYLSCRASIAVLQWLTRLAEDRSTNAVESGSSQQGVQSDKGVLGSTSEVPSDTCWLNKFRGNA
jgi:hypothetical protein